jgi:methylmalonyl-CoA/ethylmalonyl-CoA epimerase
MTMKNALISCFRKKRTNRKARGSHMKIEKIDHICFAVKDLEKTKRVYREDFGLIPTYEYIAESEKIKVARYYIGEVAVEFMESTALDGKVAKFIDTRGEGAYLISYKVDDLSEAIKELKEKNIKLIDNKPRELFGTRYAFVHHPNKLHGVLTELLEGDFDINK